MPTYKTPDVYVEEISLLPPSVAEVGTAIPAFVGYTAIAQKAKADDLLGVPTKIRSLKQYELYYGFPFEDKISATVTKADGAVEIVEPDPTYLLYWSVQLYFDNGGSECYIVSAGKYKTPPAVEFQALSDALATVTAEDEPTLLVVPEAVQLTAGDFSKMAEQMLLQCGDLRDRFAILDVRDGDIELDSAKLKTNRGAFGMNNLKYGAAYYPYLHTKIPYYVNEDKDNVRVKVDAAAEKSLGELETLDTAAFNLVRAKLAERSVVLPPSGAVAGVYAATDAARGVWKAPANVSLNSVAEPLIRLDSKAQEEFNVDTTGGKSINAIRAFSGKGTLVWGARTLAGNDNEWRYISVRRFFNMVEESVKKSTYWAVFEPNDANTWVKVRGMIESYLLDKWREGALAGAVPKDAFFVKCGLGITMNSQDILEGRLNVEIGLAVVRPAEFIILKFSHKLQTS